MILIEGSWWPLIAVGLVSELPAPHDRAVIIGEHCLELTDDLRVVLVVAGNGESAVRAQRDLLVWLRRVRHVITPRLRRLAWVLEDDAVRICTEAWLRFSYEPHLDVPTGTFRRMSDAIGWLIAPAETSVATGRDAALAECWW